MLFSISRRCWLLSAAFASVSTAPAWADPPLQRPRIASATLPIPSRNVRLGKTEETRTVVTSIAVDPRGELVAVSGDDFTIRVLQASTMALVESLEGHRDIIRTMTFDAAGDKLVSAGNDGQLIIWDRNESFRPIQKMQGTPALACVRFSPDGTEMAAVGFDDRVYLIGRGDRDRVVLRCDCRDLRSVAYRDDNRILAVVGRSGDLYLFDPISGNLTAQHALHQGRIHDVVFHAQSNTAVCVGDDGHVTMFDSENEQLLGRIRVTTGKLFAATVLNSQLVAVAGSDNLIRVVNTDNATVIRTLDGHSGSVSALAAGVGSLFSGSYDATLRRWSIGSIESSAQRIAEGDAGSSEDTRIDR